MFISTDGEKHYYKVNNGYELKKKEKKILWFFNF